MNIIIAILKGGAPDKPSGCAPKKKKGLARTLDRVPSSLPLSQVGIVPPPLPATYSFHKLDPQLLEGRREALQSYLQKVVSEAFLTAHPQALAPIILFLSQEMYSHSSTELTRKVRHSHCV